MDSKIIVGGDIPDFQAMLDAYPHFTARILGYIGSRAMNLIFEKHLSGQDLTYHISGRTGSGNPLSEGAPLRSFGKSNRGGRRMMGYYVLKGLRGVSIYSKPLAQWESRKHIMKRSKSEMSGMLARWGEEAMKMAVKQEAGFEEFKA
jgi:hypothetical protein